MTAVTENKKKELLNMITGTILVYNNTDNQTQMILGAFHITLNPLVAIQQLVLVVIGSLFPVSENKNIIV